ncbi:Extracellular sulfatase Sulf-1 [Chamberlinius hualienensis]
MKLSAITSVILLALMSYSLVVSKRANGNVATSSSSSSYSSIFHLDSSESVDDTDIPFRKSRHGFSKTVKGRKHGHPKPERKPNIIVILTDDQDVELGSMNYMPKALKVLQKGGTNFRNAFVTTPMCCPSRSSILTGMYVHNHHVFTNNDNCSSRYWQQTMETRSFATYLNNVGYRTGYFGKYLNEYNGSYIPPGWREWSALIRNSRFYNYTINRNGVKKRYGDDYYKDYYPDLITNESIAFFEQSKKLSFSKPVMMVLSYPAPHGPEDAAPQFQSEFFNITSHRTKSWNIAPNYDKQWILRETGQMEEIHKKFTDSLHRKRLQTLLSVDDAVDRIYNTLNALGELNNTYIMYTSDHGYHLGQFGLVKGKAMPFDFDIRVPFYVRGPKVPHGINISNVVANLDIAPTLLDMAGIEVPEHMDGKSILKLIVGADELSSSGSDSETIESQLMRKKTWRDTVLIESAGRQNAGERRKKPYKPKIPATLLTFSDRGIKDHSRLSEVCRKPHYKFPCSVGQRWSCYFDGKRWRMQRCRYKLKQRQHHRFVMKNDCVCPETNLAAVLEPSERRRQRAFIRDHVKKNFRPQFIGFRGRRSSRDFDVNEVFELHQILELKYEFPELVVNDGHLNSSDWRDAILPKTERSVKPHSSSGCKLTRGSIVNCSDEVYNNPGKWRENKSFVDSQIKMLKSKLDELKDIRKHLKRTRPGETVFGPKDKGHKTRVDLEGSELDIVEENQCICDGKLYGNGGRRKSLGSRRDEKKRLKEERLRLKEEREQRRQEKLKRQEKKSRRKMKYENYTCNIEKMNCFVHDNDHWKTPPFWTDGPFCFCQNANNNTYWCLRTINASHNFLYCEFITGFINFYDMTVDRHQLQNIINEVPFAVVSQLHHQLMKMRACQGARECTVRSRIRGSHFSNPSTAFHDNYENQPVKQGRSSSTSVRVRKFGKKVSNLGNASGRLDDYIDDDSSLEADDNFDSFSWPTSKSNIDGSLKV